MTFVALVIRGGNEMGVYVGSDKLSRRRPPKLCLIITTSAVVRTQTGDEYS